MIQKQPFGKTGHISTRTLFGAAALGKVTQSEADQTLEVLLEYGVNHIDTAASYGESELRIGPWMPAHRDELFLATKTGERTRQGAWDELQSSLKRLRVDSIDLWQMHGLMEPDEWEVTMGPNGALEAFTEAREQGLVRFLGVTGHGTQVAAMHIRSLERFPFDSVLLPYNYPMMQNAQYAADFEKLLDLCEERRVAVQTIKSVCRRPWDDRPHTRNTWYESMEEQEDIDLVIHWALKRPGIFINTAADIHLLPRILDAASRFGEGPSDERMAQEAERLEMAPLFE